MIVTVNFLRLVINNLHTHTYVRILTNIATCIPTLHTKTNQVRIGHTLGFSITNIHNTYVLQNTYLCLYVEFEAPYTFLLLTFVMQQLQRKNNLIERFNHAFTKYKNIKF